MANTGFSRSQGRYFIYFNQTFVCMINFIMIFHPLETFRGRESIKKLNGIINFTFEDILGQYTNCQLSFI